jgi:hypothetical protein
MTGLADNTDFPRFNQQCPDLVGNRHRQLHPAAGAEQAGEPATTADLELMGWMPPSPGIV